MDLIQNGESSRSPHTLPQPTHTHADELSSINGDKRDADGDVEMNGSGSDGRVPVEAGVAGEVGHSGNGDAHRGVVGEGKAEGMDVGVDVDGDGGLKRGTARLILPQWDVRPEKPVHASQDLISLLHLDTLYNAYVRPFTDVPPDEGFPDGQADGQAGQGGKRKGWQKRKMEKGYQHLVDDCIDPMPFAKSEVLSLLPLLGDMIPPPAPPPRLPEGPLKALPDELFERVKLDVGTQDGYHGHVKQGVREAEEKRQRKALNRKSMTLDPASPAIHSAFPGRTPTPGTPLLPVAPPQRGLPNQNPNFRRGTAPPGQGQGGVRPFPGPGAGAGVGIGPGVGPGGRPLHPSSKQRPVSLEAQGVYKKSKMGSRSASPMPGGPGTATGTGAGQMSQAQAQAHAQAQAQRGYPPNRGKRTGSADVQGGNAKRAKSGSRSESPMPGAGAGAKR